MFPFRASGNGWPERVLDSAFSLEVYNVCFKGVHKLNKTEGRLAARRVRRQVNPGRARADLRGGHRAAGLWALLGV